MADEIDISLIDDIIGNPLTDATAPDAAKTKTVETEFSKTVGELGKSMRELGVPVGVLSKTFKALDDFLGNIFTQKRGPDGEDGPGMFSSIGKTFTKTAQGLAVFGLAVQGAKMAVDAASAILRAFTDVNASIAIAFERLQLFMQGVLVVLADALAPILTAITDALKSLVTAVLPILVSLIKELTPVIVLLSEAFIGLINWIRDLFGMDPVRPMDIEQEGLKRAATGVANMLSQFANSAKNPQGNPAVVVNIAGDEEKNFDALMQAAIGHGDNIIAELVGGGERGGAINMGHHTLQRSAEKREATARKVLGRLF